MEFARIIDANATLDIRVLIVRSRLVLHHVVYMVHATMVHADVKRATPESRVRFKNVIRRVKTGDCVWTTLVTALIHFRVLLVRLVLAARSV